MPVSLRFSISGSVLRVLALMALITALVVVHPSAARANPLYAALVMDAETGQILHQSNADKSLHPASLVKIMTLTMVFDELAAGRISLRDRITVSSHAANMVPSKIGFKPGATISVEDAVYALVTKSANDVAVAVGEHIGGSESRFAQMMTRRAREIGMTRTTFRNASGLHHPQQVSTARDMARLGRYVIKRYPQYYAYFSTRDFNYRGQNFHNHNRLMSSYAGMDGIKTGYIGASGFNLVSSAVRGNRRLIGVVFGGRSAASRNAHMAQLLDRHFGTPAPPVLVASAPAARSAGNVRMAANIAPVPPRKPQTITQLAALYNNDGVGELAGQGDADPSVARRIESGLRAMADQQQAGVKIAALSPANIIPADQRPWAIQIGAFESRARTDAALRDTLARLPENLSHGSPFIAPLKTGDSWLFRARLGGYSREQAIAACQALRDCLPVAPQAF